MILGGLGASGDGLWAVLGRSWGVLGRLGPSVGGLGAVLGRSWGGLGATLGRLGASWGGLGMLGNAKERLTMLACV